MTGRRAWLVLVGAVLLVPQAVLAGDRAFEVLHYEARLDPDIDAGTLKGRERIHIRATAQLRELAFDAGELQIEQVHAGGVHAAFVTGDSRVSITLPAVLERGAEQDLVIDYRGAPKYGLEFHARDARQAYTIFSTSQWLVVLDDPSVRATLDLSVAVPQSLQVAGHGPASRRSLPGGLDLVRWRMEEPVPSFVYGFAIGAFQEATDARDDVQLRFLSAHRTPDELRKIFAGTADMLTFFSRIAGIPYRGQYDQVLVAQTVGQEAARFALLSDAYGERVLGGANSDALIAHEIAHQWWGVLVTCADWGHFWLNEGLAVFMAAAWMEQQSGRDAYDRQVDAWRARVERLQASGKDHGLVYASWDHPSADDRAVVYQKGAYVLHLLRETLREEAFWRGIRAYTLGHRGRSVTTADFQAAMEQASGRDLAAFFDRWAWAGLRQSGHDGRK